jgi:hypothetical protein
MIKWLVGMQRVVVYELGQKSSLDWIYLHVAMRKYPERPPTLALPILFAVLSPSLDFFCRVFAEYSLHPQWLVKVIENYP